jgi:hypothetical protein
MPHYRGRGYGWGARALLVAAALAAVVLARRLPGLLADAGLPDLRVRALKPFDRGPEGFNASPAEIGAAVAAQAGTIAEAERVRWPDQPRAEQAAGRSVAGLTHLFVWATVPQPSV